MNNLREIMSARGITPIELAKRSGCNVGNIRRLAKEGGIEYTTKSTVTRLAKALDVTPKELVKGGKSMKNKILKAEITKHIEAISKALRDYKDEPMYLSLTVFTRDSECHIDGDPIGVPDYYSVRVHESDIDDIEECDLTLSMSARVYYAFYDQDELIRTVIPYYEV